MFGGFPIFRRHELEECFFQCISLEKAKRWGYVNKNVADNVDAPKTEFKEAEYMDLNTATQILELMESEPIKYRLFINLSMFSGARRGEIAALTWKDIDFDEDTININKAAQYITGKGVIIKEPKNRKSRRIVTMPVTVMKMLKEYKKIQSEGRLKIGDLWKDNNYIFTQWNGEIIRPDTFTAWFSKFVKKNNLPNGIHIHTIRHTNASMLIANGQDVVTVSKRLGHSQTSTTLNIYAHALRSADIAAANKLDDLLSV